MRRVVFEHPSGLRRICGVLEDEHAPAVVVGPVTLGDDTHDRVELSRVEMRAVYYRAAVATAVMVILACVGCGS
jgi:hypothetical protein